MPAIKRLAGVAPEVNLRNSKQARKHASDSTLALKPRAHVTRKSKTGVSVAPQFFFKKKVRGIFTYIHTKYSTSVF